MDPHVKKFIETYLINTQIVFQNIIAEKYYNKGGHMTRQFFRAFGKSAIIRDIFILSLNV